LVKICASSCRDVINNHSERRRALIAHNAKQRVCGRIVINIHYSNLVPRCKTCCYSHSRFNISCTIEFMDLRYAYIISSWIIEILVFRKYNTISSPCIRVSSWLNRQKSRPIINLHSPIEHGNKYSIICRMNIHIGHYIW
jgi:hypothetical protein